MSGPEYQHDPSDISESAAENWYAENVDADGNFKCACGATCNLSNAHPSGPSPYALPMCQKCAFGEGRQA